MNGGLFPGQGEDPTHQMLINREDSHREMLSVHIAMMVSESQPGSLVGDMAQGILLESYARSLESPKWLECISNVIGLTMVDLA